MILYIHQEGDNYLQQGWALKSKKKRVLFNDDQVKYMKEKFYAGKRTGSKVDPYKATQQQMVFQ
jgi:hypothetical protein